MTPYRHRVIYTLCYHIDKSELFSEKWRRNAVYLILHVQEMPLIGSQETNVQAMENQLLSGTRFLCPLPECLKQGKVKIWQLGCYAAGFTGK